MSLIRRRYARVVSSLFVCLLSLAAAPATSIAHERAHSSDKSLLSEAEYREHITYLASDELEGRGTGQDGNDRAADYIAGFFKDCGVQPAGDDDTYFQNFKLQLSQELGDNTRLTYARSGRKMRIPFELKKDYIPFPFSASKEFEGDVVFAGYGIVDDDKGYNDYADVDVTDKIVLIIRRSPQFKEFSAMMHQSFRAKANRANARGASAILIVNRVGDDEDEGLYPFDQGGGGMMSRGYGIPMIHITEEAANSLLKAAKMPTVAELQEKIEKTEKPASALLKGVTVQGDADIRPIDSPVRNVVGIIPGKGPQSDEIIVLGAHYDHLGIRNKGEPGFDPTRDISNGADDNASGTSLVMSMAKAYTAGQAPNRSILLILFTGEEMGLLGSAQFARHPTVDLTNCVAMLNFDMVGRLKNNRLEVGGMRTGDGFEDLVKNLAADYDLEIRDGGGGRGPSDHTSFYNKKVPVLFFFTGIHKQYHKPDDDTPLINFDGAIRIARYAADIIDEIDSNPERPAYHEDTRRANIGNQSDDDKAPSTANGRPRRADRPRRGEDRNADDEDRGPRGVRLGVMPDVDDEPGLLVAEVTDDSPASKAGVKDGDRIKRIGKIKVDSIEDALEALSKLEPGDSTTLGIDRNGKSIELKVSFPAPSRVAVRNSDGDPVADAVESAVRDAIKKFDTGEDCKFTVKPAGRGFKVKVSVSNRDIINQLAIDISGRLGPLSHPPQVIEFDITVHSNGGPANFQSMQIIMKPVVGEPHPTDAKERPKADPHHAANPHADAKADRKDNPHGDAGDDESRETMPAVRLGIMPTYGETEGEGYEIDGVVAGGPAAKAGIKDGDRIYRIGDKKVTNVYEYMDALRKFKPGDEIPVVVIREGKKIELKVKAGEPKAEPN